MIDIRKSRCHVYPGLPRVKLYPDVASRYFAEPIMTASARCLSTKLVVHLERRQYCSSEIPINCLIFLRRDTHRSDELCSLTTCTQMEAFLGLLKNCYNTINVDKTREQTQFTFCSRLASVLPSFRFGYFSDLSRLAEISARLDREISKLSLALPFSS